MDSEPVFRAPEDVVATALDHENPWFFSQRQQTARINAAIAKWIFLTLGCWVHPRLWQEEFPDPLWHQREIDQCANRQANSHCC